MKCEQQRAIMPISPALEESRMREGDPKEVEDEEGLSKSGETDE